MIKKIAIVPFVTYSMGLQMGYDGHLNMFRKSRSEVLKENLEHALQAEKIEAEVVVDVDHGDLQSLKRKGVDFMLIPSQVSNYVDYEGIDKSRCYKLSDEEYEKGAVADIVERIRKLY